MKLPDHLKKLSTLPQLNDKQALALRNFYIKKIQEKFDYLTIYDVIERSIYTLKSFNVVM